HFNFGTSEQTSGPVINEIEARLPLSLFLGLYAYVLTIVFGISLGTAAALKRWRGLDRAIGSFGIFATAMPAYFAGIVLLYVFAILIPVFPVFGQGHGFFNELWHLTLPAVAMALALTALVLRHTRASMIGVLDQDYITFARARGLSARRVLISYALRNAL